MPSLRSSCLLGLALCFSLASGVTAQQPPQPQAQWVDTRSFWSHLEALRQGIVSMLPADVKERACQQDVSCRLTSTITGMSGAQVIDSQNNTHTEAALASARAQTITLALPDPGSAAAAGSVGNATAGSGAERVRSYSCSSLLGSVPVPGFDVSRTRGPAPARLVVGGLGELCLFDPESERVVERGSSGQLHGAPIEVVACDSTCGVSVTNGGDEGTYWWRGTHESHHEAGAKGNWKHSAPAAWIDVIREFSSSADPGATDGVSIGRDGSVHFNYSSTGSPRSGEKGYSLLDGLGAVTAYARRGLVAAVAGLGSASISLWDLRVAPAGLVINIPVPGDTVTSLALGGRYLAASLKRGGVTVWDLAANRVSHRIPYRATSLALLEDGKTLVAANGGFAAWDLDQSIPVAAWAAPAGPGGGPCAVVRPFYGHAEFFCGGGGAVTRWRLGSAAGSAVAAGSSAGGPGTSSLATYPSDHVGGIACVVPATAPARSPGSAFALHYVPGAARYHDEMSARVETDIQGRKSSTAVTTGSVISAQSTEAGGNLAVAFTLDSATASLPVPLLRERGQTFRVVMSKFGMALPPDASATSSPDAEQVAWNFRLMLPSLPPKAVGGDSVWSDTLTVSTAGQPDLSTRAVRRHRAMGWVSLDGVRALHIETASDVAVSGSVSAGSNAKTELSGGGRSIRDEYVSDAGVFLGGVQRDSEYVQMRLDSGPVVNERWSCDRVTRLP